MAIYYYLNCTNPESILTYSLPDPNDDDLWFDEEISEMPDLPLQIEIQPGYEKKKRKHHLPPCSQRATL